MKKLFDVRIALAGMAIACLPSYGGAQKDASGKPTVLQCCKCLGDSTRANLSTAAPVANGPVWTVVKPARPGGPLPPPALVVTASNPAWSPVPGAQWVGPAGAPEDPGDYLFETKIDLRRCVIPSASITISGSFLSDNTAQLLIDGNPVVINYGFGPANPTPFSYTFLPGAFGVHSVSVKVTNDGGPIGLSLQATAVRKCASNLEVPIRKETDLGPAKQKDAPAGSMVQE